MRNFQPYRRISKLVEVGLEWNGRMGFACKSASGHETTIDASMAHGGNDFGGRPMELLLFALCGCTGMDIVTFLRKRKRDLQDLRIKSHGLRVPHHPHMFEKITLHYTFTGSDLKDEDVRWAIDLSLSKYSSVAAMLQKSCKINYRWKIIRKPAREAS